MTRKINNSKKEVVKYFIYLCLTAVCDTVTQQIANRYNVNY